MNRPDEPRDPFDTREARTVLHIGVVFAAVMVVAGPMAALLAQTGLPEPLRFGVVFVVAMAVSLAVQRFRERQEMP